MNKYEIAVKANVVLEKAAKGMTLNAIAKEMHYGTSSLKAKIYFGLRDQVKSGAVNYGAKAGKEKLFELTGKPMVAPVKAVRAKKAVVAKKPAKAVKKAKPVVEAPTVETTEAKA